MVSVLQRILSTVIYMLLRYRSVGMFRHSLNRQQTLPHRQVMTGVTLVVTGVLVYVTRITSPSQPHVRLCYVGRQGQGCEGKYIGLSAMEPFG